jgi:ACT domain-containing protein
MTVQQISVFLENKFGRLNEILNLIAQEDIRIISATIADTSEFGILRIITTDPHKTYQLLKSNNISANMSDVFAIITESRSGQFAQTIECFTKAGINIEYMYCFSTKQTGVLILRTNNIEPARDVIRKKNLPILPIESLSEI